MNVRTAPFDIAKHLDSEEMIVAYLSAALDDGDPELFLMALGNVAKTRGMAQIADLSGLGHEGLNEALALGARPRYDTVMKLVRAVGVKLTAVPDRV